MDKSLIRSAMINSGLLTIVFVTNTISSFSAGGTLGAVLGALGIYVTYLTGRDTVQLYKALN